MRNCDEELSLPVINTKAAILYLQRITILFDIDILVADVISGITFLVKYGIAFLICNSGLHLFLGIETNRGNV